MTAQYRRSMRMLFKGALLICLPLTGFVWALPYSSFQATAIVLTALSAVVGIGAELLASSNEAELKQITAQLARDQRQRADELGLRDEKIRQFDRVVQLLTEQNHNLRAKLLNVHTDLQRQREVLAAHVNGAGSVEELVPQRRAFATRGL